MIKTSVANSTGTVNHAGSSNAIKSGRVFSDIIFKPGDPLDSKVIVVEAYPIHVFASIPRGYSMDTTRIYGGPSVDCISIPDTKVPCLSGVIHNTSDEDMDFDMWIVQRGSYRFTLVSQAVTPQDVVADDIYVWYMFDDMAPCDECCGESSTTGDGAEGPQGEKGDTGDTGPTGADGPQGVEGEQGADGADGADGIGAFQGKAAEFRTIQGPAAGIWSVIPDGRTEAFFRTVVPMYGAQNFYSVNNGKLVIQEEGIYDVTFEVPIIQGDPVEGHQGPLRADMDIVFADSQGNSKWWKLARFNQLNPLYASALPEGSREMYEVATKVGIHLKVGDLVSAAITGFKDDPSSYYQPQQNLHLRLAGAPPALVSL